MNRARLRELGFELAARAEAGVSGEGAWFATAPDGAPVVLKWFPDETVAERYAVLLPGLDELRSRGVPVPGYPHVLAVDNVAPMRALAAVVRKALHQGGRVDVLAERSEIHRVAIDLVRLIRHRAKLPALRCAVP